MSTVPDYDLALDELSVALSYVALGLGSVAVAATPVEKKAEKKNAKKVRFSETVVSGIM